MAKLDATSTNPMIHFQLGDMFGRSRQYSKAIDSFKTALDHSTSEDTYQKEPLKPVLMNRLFRFFRRKALTESGQNQLEDALATVKEGFRFSLTDIQKAEMSILTAQFQARLNNLEVAVEKYHSIKRNFRETSYTDQDGKEHMASTYAARQIDE